MSLDPPGPTGAPVVGNSHQYARDPFRFIEAVRDTYGDLARFRLGREPTYMVSDPASVERILVSESDRFSKPTFQTDALEALLGKGLLVSEGAFWREMRTLAQPAFSMDRIARAAETMVDYAETMCEGWTPGETVTVESEMASVTVGIIVEAMFGTTLGERRTELVKEHLEPLGRRFEPDARRVLIPEWVPTSENRQYDRSIRVLEGIIDELIAERRAAGVEGDGDLLAILLRAYDDDEIDDRQVRDELMTMLLAGHDTTALTLTYTWHLLGANPGAAERLYAEIDDVVGDERPTMAHVRELEYTSWVLNEAMRIYPPVYVLFREPTEDVVLEGYDVPAGSLVMLPQWGFHRDPRYFDDPLAFRPERWADPDHPTFAYFPFGAGPRSCIGKQFSLLEAKLILATVASRYRIETVDDRLDLRASLTMHPKPDTPVEAPIRER